MTAPFRTYLITDSERFGRERTLEVVAAAAEAGVEAVQVREKHLDAKALIGFTSDALDAVRPHGTRLLVNGRPDVALTVGADGVHLGHDAIHPEAARELANRHGREDFLIGASAHSRAEVARASAGNADFVVFGPIFSTPGKATVETALGLDPLREVCEDGWIPVLALGGITAANVADALTAGASGTSCIRAVFDAEDPLSAARLWVGAHD